MKRWTFILLACLAVGTIPAQADLHRGVWFWRNGSSPYGSDNIVGSSSQETATVSFFKKYGIRRVYGSYGNRPIYEPSIIASWNERLHLKGIQSQLLLAENSWIFPANRGALLDRI
ncbi:MAG: hypothetical protein GWQ05_07545 [Verrucomicrobiaceae bacterium]|nr:hypothetical protein [Verrucomicrobiaceae bacterium]